MHELLKDTKLNKTCFKRKGEEDMFFSNSFRLIGYMFIYETWDGERIFAHVNKCQANGVSGVGVCGTILKVDDIEFTQDVSVNIKDSEHMKYLVKQDKKKYQFLKSLPAGLTKEQIDFFSMERAINSAMKSIKKKKV